MIQIFLNVTDHCVNEPNRSRRPASPRPLKEQRLQKRIKVSLGSVKPGKEVWCRNCGNKKCKDSNQCLAKVKECKKCNIMGNFAHVCRGGSATNHIEANLTTSWMQNDPILGNIKVINTHFFIIFKNCLSSSMEIWYTYMQRLFAMHQALAKMMALARKSLWWPFIANDVANMALSCKPCQEK